MAAKKLGYTQSGLHYIINSVEDELGLKILERTSKGVALNSDGDKIVLYLENLLSAESDLRQRASELAGKKQSLHIGVLPCISSSLLPDILKNFLTENPDATVDCRITFTDLRSAFELGETDLTILPRYAVGNYPYHHLMRTHFCAAVPESMIEEDAKAITVEEFLKHPVIVTTTNPENMVFNALAKQDLSYNIRCSVLGATTTLAMVAKGLGVTYLSALYDRECPPGVRILPFEPVFKYDIGIISKTSSENMPLINSFIRIAQDFCEKFEIDG